MLICRTSFWEHIHFFTNLKFVRENFIYFIYSLTWPDFLKMFLSPRIGHLKNIFERTRISRWLGREHEENVARTKNVVVGIPPLVQLYAKLLMNRQRSVQCVLYIVRTLFRVYIKLPVPLLFYPGLHQQRFQTQDTSHSFSYHYYYQYSTYIQCPAGYVMMSSSRVLD